MVATIIISIIIFGICAAIVCKMITDKKHGKGSCGCGCANCALKGQCHKDE